MLQEAQGRADKINRRESTGAAERMHDKPQLPQEEELSRGWVPSTAG